jgi:hypothetical protein
MLFLCICMFVRLFLFYWEVSSCIYMVFKTDMCDRRYLKLEWTIFSVSSRINNFVPGLFPSNRSYVKSSFTQD